jgi:hypothetical protein
MARNGVKFGLPEVFCAIQTRGDGVLIASGVALSVEGRDNSTREL